MWWSARMEEHWSCSLEKFKEMNKYNNLTLTVLTFMYLTIFNNWVRFLQCNSTAVGINNFVVCDNRKMHSISDLSSSSLPLL